MCKLILVTIAKIVFTCLLALPLAWSIMQWYGLSTKKVALLGLQLIDQKVCLVRNLAPCLGGGELCEFYYSKEEIANDEAYFKTRAPSVLGLFNVSDTNAFDKWKIYKFAADYTRHVDMVERVRK